MAKKNILEIILNTIDQVKKSNANNPREETADPTVFDLLKEKIGELDKNIQNKRAQKGKSPVSILDLIKGQIEAARKHNEKDPNVKTAPSSIFDKLNKKLEQRPKRTASSGIRKIIKEYNIDVSRLTQNTLNQIQQKYDMDRRKLDQGYAQAIYDMTKR